MMALKKRDDEISRRYWEFVEKTAREVQEQRPNWAEEPQSRRTNDRHCDPSRQGRDPRRVSV